MTYPTAILVLFLPLTLCAQAPIPKLPSSPTQIVVDSRDNVIAHLYRGRVVKITPDGKMTYLSEDIQKSVQKSPYPKCKVMAIDTRDNVYMADESLIWKMTPDGKITLFAGVPFMYRLKDGPLQTAQFSSIDFIEVAPDGTIYVAERDNSNKDNLGDFYVIRKISTTGLVTTVANTRESTTLKTNWIAGMGIDADGTLYLSDGAGRCIKKMDANGTAITLAGMCGKREFHPVYVQGNTNKAELMAPTDILINRKGELIFTDSRLHRVIKVANSTVTTVAGSSEIQPNNLNMGGRAKEGYRDGKALAALFNFPLGCSMAIDSNQNIYVIDGGNECIRKLSSDGIVSTFAK